MFFDMHFSLLLLHTWGPIGTSPSVSTTPSPGSSESVSSEQHLTEEESSSEEVTTLLPVQKSHFQASHTPEWLTGVRSGACKRRPISHATAGWLGSGCVYVAITGLNCS